jgi:hypothetical protein
VLIELVRLADATDESAAELVQDEWLALTEQLTAALGAASDLFASFEDVLMSGDQITARRTLEVTVDPEVLVVTEAAGAERTLDGVASELLLLSDAATAIQDHLAVVSEVLLLTDDPSERRLDPIEQSVVDAIVVTDDAVGDLVDSSIMSVLVDAELVMVAESPIPAVGLSTVVSEVLVLVEAFWLAADAGTEGLQVTDIAQCELDPLERQADEEAVQLTDGPVSATTALPVEVGNEVGRLDDSDLTVAMQLAANPGNEDDLTVAVFEDCRLREGAKVSFYAVPVAFRGTYPTSLHTIGTVAGPIQTIGTVD